MMLGLLLSRMGLDVVVLEKHADFLRDFRGDTVHPSTMEVMHEIGLLPEFLARPHQEVREIGGQIGRERVMFADFSRLPTHARFVALMPQWHFLDFLAEHARRYPGFHLRMRAEVGGLIQENGRIAGVTATTPEGPLDVRSDLTVGADGRESTVRRKANLVVKNLGVPIDVLWLRLSRRSDDPGQTLGYFSRGHLFVMLDRGEYWQCAFVIPKGGFGRLQREGLPPFRDRIAGIVPFLRDRLEEIRTWNDVKLLTVRIDRLRQWWRPGLLCIGDAAHAMSPIGGVGINLAIQDAVAAANILGPALRRGVPTYRDLRRVQRRRELPTRMTQRLQILVQERVIRRTLAGRAPRVPRSARLLARWPRLRRIPARIVGVGFRPEHVSDSIQPRTVQERGVEESRPEL